VIIRLAPDDSAPLPLWGEGFGEELRPGAANQEPALSGSTTTRRTCASLLVALDVHPRVAMQVLRHSRITVTMDVYSEVPSEATQEALRRLGESLDG
jgi:hypothetical protein